MKKKQRIRYRVICWLMSKLTFCESGKLYFDWLRSNAKIHSAECVRIYKQDTTAAHNDAINVVPSLQAIGALRPTCPTCGQYTDHIGQ